MNRQEIYLVSIGGIGMCPLAIYLSKPEYKVTGIDDSLREDVKQLLTLKSILIDKKGCLPEQCGAVICSSAINKEHLIYKQAKARAISLYRRGEFLAKILKGKRLLVIIGSHGKITTHGMAFHSLKRTGYRFGYLNGALSRDPSLLPAHDSGSEWVVAGIGKRSDTIEGFTPDVTLVVNFDWDHPDRYKSSHDLERTFKNLFERTKDVLILSKNCNILQDIAKEIYKTVVAFEVEQIHSYGEADFNRENAAAVLAIINYLTGTGSAAYENSLEGFLGIKHPQALLYEDDNQCVMMDYAHHPAQIEAFIKSVAFKHDCDILAVQPHRYAGTQIYYREFAQVLSKNKKVALLAVYTASKQILESGTTQVVYNEVLKLKNSADVYSFLFSKKSFGGTLDSILGEKPSKPRSTVFIGACDIEQLALHYTKYLKEKEWWDSLTEALSEETKVLERESLYNKTTLRVGGRVKFYAEPATLADLQRLLREAKKVDCPFFMLGRGSNLVVDDEGYDGLVIRLNDSFWRAIEPLDRGRLKVRAGARLKEICGHACKLGLAGFEFLEGIPGSLGGSLRMNAGAMGGWLFDVVESVEYLTYDGAVSQQPKDYFTLGYRYCKELKETIVISAVLKGVDVTDQSSIRDKINRFATVRKTSQPRESSAGCIFKNPQGNHAGQLIEAAGMKGASVGEAEVSLVHANFIINRGNATSKDVVNLVRHVRAEVKKTSGIDLEPEVLLLGKTWDELLA